MLQLQVSMVAAQGAGAAGAVTTPPFSLNPSNRESRSCTLPSGREGVCVKYTQCRGNRTIDIYGSIDDNEIRVGECAGHYYWCCEHDAPPPPRAECPNAADCPWCVTLHRSGGNPRTRAADGRHCGGALLADGGALLTASSCVRAATRQTSWAVRAARNYSVHSAATHKDYNSGTRENDLALIVLSETAGAGACLPPAAAAAAPPPGAACLTVGYQPDGTLVLTEVEVSAGPCGERGGAAGALCARARGDEGACRVTLGAPLLCAGEGEASGWAVWGVSRGGGCAGGAQYSAVGAAREWLAQLLPEAPGPVTSITEGS